MEVVYVERNMKSSHTEKKIIILKDRLDAEVFAIKKLMDYKDSLMDSELTNMVDDLINKHKAHYNRLYNHITW